MATIQTHLNQISNQLELLSEQGHLKHPNEYWAMQEVETALAYLKRQFVTNGRTLDDDTQG
jgi:hypothetical protein